YGGVRGIINLYSIYTRTKEDAAPAQNEETDRIMEENVNEKISMIHYTKGGKKFIIGVKSSRKRWKVGDMRC
ncbi:MAG TPA: hypothetical protein H9715_03895, partial [Candidatus Merdibacter merdigallinarum]|nr:hypothetical protein [Candidatus Merdibacter merdigallinarum]